jgi:hypothetical protein
MLKSSFFNVEDLRGGRWSPDLILFGRRIIGWIGEKAYDRILNGAMEVMISNNLIDSSHFNIPLPSSSLLNYHYGDVDLSQQDTPDHKKQPKFN